MDPTATATATADGWQKVTYPKRHRRAQPPPPAVAEEANGGSHVFDSLELKSSARRRAIEATAAADLAVGPAAVRSDDDSDEDLKDNGGGGDDVAAAKEKVKKPKKPKLTVADAAAKIDADDLSAHLLEVSIPLCHISDPVYKTSADWISQKSMEVLGNFVLWCLDTILADLASQQPVGKGSKKSVQQPSLKSQVAIFVVLAMTLRRKPDVLISLLPKLRDDLKYQGHEKFPLIVWVIGQASQGDLVAGMYAWVHYLLPLISGKSNVNPQSRDLALQLVDRILLGPKTRSILLNGAVRKGERLVPPSALDLLMRVTFPTQSARIKATDRFEAIYPTLKELALAGSPGTKTTKQASQQLLPSCVKAMQENNPELAKEAADIFIWCLVQNPDCYKQWEKLHLGNMDATVAVLRKLSDGLKEYSAKLSPPDALRQTIKNLRVENERALSGAVDASNQATIKEADKFCKAILGKISRGSGCVKGGLFVLMIAVAVGFAVSPNLESLDWNKLHSMFTSSLQSFST